MKNLTTTVARTGFDSERLGSLSRLSLATTARNCWGAGGL
jgi:hypothetical protein